MESAQVRLAGPNGKSEVQPRASMRRAFSNAAARTNSDSGRPIRAAAFRKSAFSAAVVITMTASGRRRFGLSRAPSPPRFDPVAPFPLTAYVFLVSIQAASQTNDNNDGDDDGIMDKGNGRGARSQRSETFERKTLSVSRDAEFASVEELQKQTGHPAAEWPLVVIKELIDNALDDAEKTGVVPEIAIEINVEEAVITVADHCSGIPPATVKKLADLKSKTSSNSAYASPTRGQQGNALQTIIPMGCALAREHGWDASDAVVIIEAQDFAQRVGFAIDPLRQTASVNCVKERSAVKTGTRVTVRWPTEACFLIAAAASGFLSLLAAYSFVNPHLSLEATWRDSDRGRDAEDFYRIDATSADWSMWLPNLATSPHWYSDERLRA
jgi:Histidine kinase-, DNA gyrase B-, and HSP90-like ATPase